MSKVALTSIYFNRGKEVDVTMKSMLAARTAGTRIIVIDDGSTDDTADRLSPYSGPDVQIIRQSNKGFSASLADHLSSLNCDYIAICGSGDICHPQRLIRQVALMDARPDIAFCGTSSRNIDPKTGEIIDMQTFREGELSADDFIESPPFTHGTAIIRTSAYRAANGYDRRFEFSQDWDLWFRLLSHGKGYFINEILYDRQVLADGASFNAAKAEKQLLFKYAAIHLNSVGQNDRDSILESVKTRGIKALPDAQKLMRRDLSTRYIKLLISGEYFEANKLRNTINERHNGLSIIFLIATITINAISRMGGNPISVQKFARWGINKYRDLTSGSKK